MTWKIKRFDELSVKEMYEILKVRTEVFVVEQNCIYQDLDSKDENAYHLFVEDQGEVVGYLRILPKGVVYQETAIGRVLIKQTHRKKGLSREMVKKAIEYIINDNIMNDNLINDNLINEVGGDAIRISAQLYLLKFYESLGFETVSDIYLEDGIEHIEMLYRR